MPQIDPNTPIGFSNDLLRAISTHTYDFIGVVRAADRKFVFVNESGAKLFEYGQAKEMLDSYASSIKKDNLGFPSDEEIKEAFTRKGFFSSEAEYITCKGNSFWGQIMLSPFSSGNYDFFLVQIEVTNRAKEAEESLVRERQKFGALLDHASIGVIIVNRKQEILLMNPFALQLFGYTQEELAGKTIETFIPQRFHDKHQGHQERYYAKQQSRPMGIGMDLYAIKKDGAEFPVEVSLGMYTADDETFVIAFINDITVRKKGEEEIKKLNAELEKKVNERTDELAVSIQQLEKQIRETEEVEIELRKSLEKEKELNELKTRFVSMASHEFRTPLSTVLSSIFLLQKYTSTEEQPKREKHIERIVSAVHTLTDILNDFLSVGKIEEGKVAPKFSVFNIKDHIEQTIHELNTILKKGQRVSYSHIGEEPTLLDPSLLKHISQNLLSNAIKFSPENSIINVATHRQDQILRFEVKDQGLGIAKEDQQHLFERFFRGTNVTTIQGTGLGLHIVQKYTEIMGGKITCISELEKGTCFVIEFALENQ